MKKNHLLGFTLRPYTCQSFCIKSFQVTKIFVLFVSILILMIPPLLANETASKTLQIDLNKLENIAKNCRISMVFHNRGNDFYQRFHMDLAFFNQDGVIAQRITVDAAPLLNKKTTIKEFDVPQLNCNQIERVLLNSISNCETKPPQATDCMSLFENSIELNSHSKIEFLM